MQSNKDRVKEGVRMFKGGKISWGELVDGAEALGFIVTKVQDRQTGALQVAIRPKEVQA